MDHDEAGNLCRGEQTVLILIRSHKLEGQGYHPAECAKV